MMNEAKLEELRQDEEMAYFHADLCLSSPESYSLEERYLQRNDEHQQSDARCHARRFREHAARALQQARAACSTSLVSSRPNGGGTCSSAKATRSTETWSR